MHKLVILIETIQDPQAFEARWPEFLHLVETMPGLQKEASSQIEEFLYGSQPYVQMHELYFASQEDARKAMVSPPGMAAGKLIQQMTGGHLILYIADHKEDLGENLRRYRETQVRDET